MVTIHPQDDVWVHVECDDAIARELNDYFTFETPGAQFMRRQARYRKWDGRIRLFKLASRRLYRGLTPRIVEFCQQRDYPCTNLVPDVTALLEGSAVDAWIDTPGRLKLAPRSYQRAAVHALLAQRRGIILSPTASGKSFIIYLVQQILNVRTLIVVPTIGLVQQMAKDFQDYGFNLDDLHTISAGVAKDDPNAKLYISTWQSIYKMPAEYFAQFDCIIVDEVHQAKAKSLSHLLEQAYTTPFRFGFTGTLDDTEAHQLILEGLFGTAVRVATTKELQDAGQLAQLRVKMVMLQYPEQERRNVKKNAAQYPDEVEYIVTHPARLAFITRLVKELKGNVLVLFNYVDKQGIPMFERIREACPDKTVHYIAGSVDGEEREDIRQFVLKEDDNQVIVASYGTFSTGSNLPNLRHLILASPSKSKVRVLQSIGRSLRLHASKMFATLWDICDDLRVGKHVNHTMRHAELRSVYYAREKFPVSLQKIDLDSFSRVQNVRDR